MAKLNEEAQAYKQKRVHNIADLQEVPLDVEVYDETDCEFPYKYIVINDERYRLPLTVLGQLKVLLEDTPECKKFKVRKMGEGKSTEYVVLPVMQ